MKHLHFSRTLIFIGLLITTLPGTAATYTINGKVFHDLNKNGNPEASEAGIRNTYIRLFYSTDFGRWHALNAKTSNSGTYSFSVELQSWETGFKYSVLELGPNPGPALQNINPRDFNHNDPDIPGGYNGTTTLRRYSGPGAIVMQSYSHHFGHANFKPFSPTLPNALVVGTEGGLSPSSIFGIDLSTGNTTKLLDSSANPVKDPIVGLGYHQTTNTFMGCTVKNPIGGTFVIIENTSPLTITKLPKGENISIYVWAVHAVDISPDGFMVDIEVGTGSYAQLIDVRPTSVNYLQMVDARTKKFDPIWREQWSTHFADQSDLTFNPGDGLMYAIDQELGVGHLFRESVRNLATGPSEELGTIYFNPPLFEEIYGFALTYCDNNNRLFVITRVRDGSTMLFRVNLDTRQAFQVATFPWYLNRGCWDGASNPNVTIPTQAAALRRGLTDLKIEGSEEPLVIKPNPAVNKKVSVSHQSGIDAVDVINISGQSLLQQKAFGKKYIDISLPSNTATGNYLIRILGSDGKVVSKNILVE